MESESNLPLHSEQINFLSAALTLVIKVSYIFFNFLENRRQKDTICSEATKTTKRWREKIKEKKPSKQQNKRKKQPAK